MTIEFDCEGCGVHVVAIVIDAVPGHHLCSVCAWLCEFVTDTEEMMAIRARMGWIERES